MTRFYGAVGFADETVETRAGVWVDRIVEHDYYGDVIKPTRRLDEVGKVNYDISTSNSLSILADQYAQEHFINMRYAVWEGVKWVVTNVEVERPRLILRLGGVYAGPGPQPVVQQEGTTP